MAKPKHQIIVDRAVRYMELEYPSLNKYRYKMGIVIYTEGNIPEDVSVTDLINCMCVIMDMFLKKERG